MEQTVLDAPTTAPTCQPVLIYPANRAGWLHILHRILGRAEAGREIGLDAVLLVLAVAVEEDARQYRLPPIFFFGELQRMLGFRSRTRLERARQKAVDAGWLIYVPGPLGDLAAARYWTMIPARLNLFEDVPQFVIPSAAEFEKSDEEIAEDTEIDDEPDEESDESNEEISGDDEPDDDTSERPLPVDIETARILDILTKKANSAPAAELVMSRSTNTPVSVPASLSSPAPVKKELGLAVAKTCEPIQPARKPTPQFPDDNSIPMQSATRLQILELYETYPHVGKPDPNQSGNDCRAIHRALSKIAFADLLRLVKKFAKASENQGLWRNPPPLVTWFDDEQWRKWY